MQQGVKCKRTQHVLSINVTLRSVAQESFKYQHNIYRTKSRKLSSKQIPSYCFRFRTLLATFVIKEQCKQGSIKKLLRV